MRASLTGYLFALSLSGCAVLDFETTEQKHDDVGNHHEGDEACKVEGDDLGRIGATAELPGGGTVTFLDWIAKTDSPGEYVGFVLSDDAEGITYAVKHGGQVFVTSGTYWMHPEGDSGPDAPAVSNVDFCECDYEEPETDDDPDFPDVE
jgi:hypothetical protein